MNKTVKKKKISCSGENRRISIAENPPNCAGEILEFYCASLFVRRFPDSPVNTFPS